MNQLRRIVESEIRNRGLITFAEFMNLALYHEDYGFYTSGKVEIGKKGDYYTSPSVHRAFGEIIGRFLKRAYEILNVSDFKVVEMGSGRGFLALDILDSLKGRNPDFYLDLQYLIVESSPHLSEQAKRVLEHHSPKVTYLSALSDLEGLEIKGVFISNELVDSFPFHRAKFTCGKLSEIFVSLENAQFAEVLCVPSTKQLTEYFDEYELEFAEGQEVEVNLLSEKWIRDVASVLCQGFLLTVDYGFLAPELFSPKRMGGTFKCIRRHKMDENPYDKIGEKDITAHVDFSNLIRSGESAGLRKIKYTTQGQFLVDWGILDVLERNSGEGVASDVSAQKKRAAIKNLFLPGLMGDRFKFLLQGKNVGALENFYPESSFRISFGVR